MVVFILGSPNLFGQEADNAVWLLMDSLYDSGSDKRALDMLDSLKKVYRNKRQLSNFIECLDREDRHLFRFFSDDKRIATAQTTIRNNKANDVFSSLEIAQANDRLALTFNNLGLYKKADSTHKKALGIYLDLFGHRHPKIASSYYYLGNVAGRMTKQDSALLYYQKSRELYLLLDAGNSRKIALINNNIGLVHFHKNYYNKALEYFTYALNIIRSTGKGEAVLTCIFQDNIALVYQELGLYEEAIEILQNSSKILYQNLGPIHMNNFYTHNTLGYIYQKQSKFDSSLIHLKKAISISESNLGVTNRFTALSITTMGLVYQKLDSFDLSLSCFNKALEIKREIYGENSSDVSRNLNFLGDLFLEQDDHLTSINYYKQAIASNVSDDSISVGDIKKGSYSVSNHDYLIASLFGMAYSIKKIATKGNSVDSLKISLNILKVTDSLIQEFRHSRTNTKDKLDMGKIATKVYDLGVEISHILYIQTGIDSYNESIFYYCERNKSAVLQQALNNLEANNIGLIPDSLKAKQKDLKLDRNRYLSKLRELDNSNDTTHRTEWESRLFKTNRTLDSLMLYLETNYSNYHDWKYNKRVLNALEARNSLSIDESLIICYEGSLNTYILSLTNNSYEIYSINKDQNSKDEISKFRELLRRSMFNRQEDIKELRESSYRLYSKYLEPALSNLDSSINKLIFVTGGQLSYIPFGILLTSKVDKFDNDQNLPYLIRKYNVRYGYSATLSLQQTDAATSKHQDDFIAFAPTYDGLSEDSVAQARLGQFRDQVTSLKFNGSEIERVNKYMQGKTLIGINATERAFKNAIKKDQILHLAMHALVDNDDPMNSKLIFSQENDSIEDNFLHAYELYNMEINAEMVVLSACETGFGKFTEGEGVMSLARAFTYAGCPSVVMSHWPVNDATTAKLMELFYKNLAAGLPKDEAMKNAKLEFLDTTDPAQANPYFWGSFVVMGDASPIDIERQMDWYDYLLLTVILLLVFGGFIFLRQSYRVRWSQ